MRFLRPGRLIIYALLVIGVIFFTGTPSFELPREVVVQEGDTYQVFLQDLGGLQKLKVRRALGGSDELQPLQVGAYLFSGVYTPETLIQSLNDGPTYEYVSVTLLEGRSSYDIDQYLTRQGLIQAGDYTDFITDRAVIDRNAPVYEFLAQALVDRPDLQSLEGYLYPETYRLDASQPIISQLVRSQLQTFDTRIWTPYGDQLLGFSDALARDGNGFGLSSYASMILGSVILKEEQYVPNMDEVAGVFVNRLDLGMRLGADITLCYGLATGYETCTPDQIVRNLYDRTNLYNTRELAGLTPTPIAGVTDDVIAALLSYDRHDNLFYLHAPDGTLHMAQTNAQHNLNKSKYLR